MINRRDAIIGAASVGGIVTAGLSRLMAAEDDHVPASPWSVGLGARTRLVRGAPLRDKQAFAAGIEIALEPGFKTYWRMPGDTGVPPVFDWSLSRNLASVVPDWPVPQRFNEAGVSGIGYAGDDVVLPLRVAATDPSKPVDLALLFSYAACKTICVPEKADMALTLRPDVPEGQYSALIEAAAREVPKRVAAAELGLDRPQATRLSLASGDSGLMIELSLGASEHILDIFVEGPENWLFGAPRTPTDGAAREVRLPLLGHPKWVDRSADIPFILTLLTDLRAIETSIDARVTA
jgi:DsbC/DsbD-like thiol-disulfide interchange protein